MANSTPESHNGLANSMVAMGMVKTAAVIGLSVMGATAIATNHDGATIDLLVGAILSVAGLATYVQYRMLARR